MELENMEQNNQVVVETNNETNNEQQTLTPSVENSTDKGLEGTQQVNQQANLEEWQKDGRYGKMWKKTDDLYNSYKSMEKSFNEVNPKYKALVKLLKDNGFQETTLNDDLKKFEDYRNPQSRINQIYNYVNGFLTNEIYSSRVAKFFDQLEQEELQRLYPNMNSEQIAKQQAMDKELKELKAKEQERQSQAEIQNNLSAIDKSLDACENLANSYGFKITDEVKNYLLNHCLTNNVLPQYIEAEFLKLYGQQLLKARDNKVIANQKANDKKLQQAQILGGGSSANSQSSTLKGKAGFLKGLEKILNNK